jgi:hypothetical protein
MRKRTIKSTPPEPPFGLDMPFDEALKRFIGTDPEEVETNVKKAKQKSPPGSKSKRKPSGGNDQSESVVSLRSRRVRKRNTGR